MILAIPELLASAIAVIGLAISIASKQQRLPNESKHPSLDRSESK
ncbi:MAG: hypothetical protein AAGC68_12030 [Verrucomicrobiota bacterium]